MPVLLNLISQPKITETVAIAEVTILKGLSLPLLVAETLTLAETSTVIRTVVGTLTCSVTDALSLGESSSLTGVRIPSSVSEAIGVAEVISLKGLRLTISLADVLTVVESSTVIRAVVGILQVSISDNLTLAEGVALEQITIIQDPVAVGDASIVQVLVQPHVTDPLALTESHFTHLLLSGLRVTEALAVAEVVTLKGLSLAISLADSLTLAEGVALVQVLVQPHVTDPVALTDTVTTVLLLQTSATDLIALTDSLLARLGSTILSNEALTLGESLTPNLISFPFAADALTVVDSASVAVASVVAHVVSVADAVAVAETVQGGIVGQTAISVTDSLTLAEAITSTGLQLTRSVSEGLALTEASQARISVSPTITDPVTYTEATTVRLALAPQVLDSLAIADASTLIGLTIHLHAADATTLAEFALVSLAGTIVFLVQDGLSLADTVTVSVQVRVWPLFTADALTVIDAIGHIRRVGGVPPPAPIPPRYLTIGVTSTRILEAPSTVRTMSIGLEAAHVTTLRIEATHTITVGLTTRTLALSVEPMHILTAPETPMQMLVLRMGEAA